MKPGCAPPGFVIALPGATLLGAKDVCVDASMVMTILNGIYYLIKFNLQSVPELSFLFFLDSNHCQEFADS